MTLLVSVKWIFVVFLLGMVETESVDMSSCPQNRPLVSFPTWPRPPDQRLSIGFSTEYRVLLHTLETS